MCHWTWKVTTCRYEQGLICSDCTLINPNKWFAVHSHLLLVWETCTTDLLAYYILNILIYLFFFMLLSKKHSLPNQEQQWVLLSHCHACSHVVMPCPFWGNSSHHQSSTCAFALQASLLPLCPLPAPSCPAQGGTLWLFPDWLTAARRKSSPGVLLQPHSTSLSKWPAAPPGSLCPACPTLQPCCYKNQITPKGDKYAPHFPFYLQSKFAFRYRHLIRGVKCVLACPLISFP